MALLTPPPSSAQTHHPSKLEFQPLLGVYFLDAGIKYIILQSAEKGRKSRSQPGLPERRGRKSSTQPVPKTCASSDTMEDAKPI